MKTSLINEKAMKTSLIIVAAIIVAFFTCLKIFFKNQKKDNMIFYLEPVEYNNNIVVNYNNIKEGMEVFVESLKSWDTGIIKSRYDILGSCIWEAEDISLYKRTAKEIDIYNRYRALLFYCKEQYIYDLAEIVRCIEKNQGARSDSIENQIRTSLQIFYEKEHWFYQKLAEAQVKYAEANNFELKNPI